MSTCQKTWAFLAQKSSKMTCKKHDHVIFSRKTPVLDPKIWFLWYFSCSCFFQVLMFRNIPVSFTPLLTTAIKCEQAFSSFTYVKNDYRDTMCNPLLFLGIYGLQHPVDVLQIDTDDIAKEFLQKSWKIEIRIKSCLLINLVGCHPPRRSAVGARNFWVFFSPLKWTIVEISAKKRYMGHMD